jgi:hypothetical protein
VASTDLRARISDNIPSTYALLAKDAGWTAVEDRYIKNEINKLWLKFSLTPISLDDVDAEDEIVRQYLADKTTIALAPRALDMIKEQTRSRNQQIDYSGGSNNLQGYDKAALFDEAIAEVRKRLIEEQPLVWEIMQGLTVVDVALVDVPATSNAGMLFDPVDRALLR